MNSFISVVVVTTCVILVAQSAPVANKTLENPSNKTLPRVKRQGYYNLGTTDFRPSEYNDGVSQISLNNPLSPALQPGNYYDAGVGSNQNSGSWSSGGGGYYQTDNANANPGVDQNGGFYMSNSQGAPVNAQGTYDQTYPNSNMNTYGTYGNTYNTYNTDAPTVGNWSENGNGSSNGHHNGNGNGNGYSNGNGYYNGYKNGNGGYNPFANIQPNQQTGQQNYLQMNYGVQGNLYNPLLPSVYGFQLQQKRPFVSAQDEHLESPLQPIKNPNTFGGYGEYNSPLTFEQIYGPYLNTAGYNPTTTTKKPKTTPEPQREKFSKSFNPYEGMTTRRIPVTPQVLWFSRYVDLTAPIAAVPFSNYNNI